MQKVVLYYPNNWKRNMGNIAPPEEMKFNWFLCAKRYKDPKTGLFVAEIARGTKFYEEHTGKTLVISLVGGRLEGLPDLPKIILLITDESDVQEKELEAYGYQGKVSLLRCSDKVHSSPEFILCKEAEFEFLPGILEVSQKERFCPIIDFSKRNNKCIRRKMPDFPTCEEINAALETSQCNIVCRVLYELIYDYLSLV